MASRQILFIVRMFSMFSASVLAVTFTITNNCPYTIWPAILATANQPQLSTTGLELVTEQTTTINAPASWSGRVWARTNCSTDSAGRFVCATGDCRTGRMACEGNQGDPPATLVELIQAGGGQDFYDISLVDGFNIPASIAPDQGDSDECVSSGCSAEVNAGCFPVLKQYGHDGPQECTPSSCPVNVNAKCPAELQLKSTDGKVIACKNACTAFKTPEYCCTGDFSDPNKCQASNYSKIFKDLCPLAYSYAFDDQSSTFTCSGGPSYVVTFCP